MGLRLTSRRTCYFLIFGFFLSFFFSKGYCQTTGLFNFFEICKEIHFISLFFLNERNITTSLLMAHSKCAIVHYANLNSSYINKLLLNYRPLKILFLFFFFNFLFTFIERGFCQKKSLTRVALSHKMAASKRFCEITQKSSFNSQYS